jgi:hypothetical protein
MRSLIFVALVFAAGMYTGTHAREILHELEAAEQTINNLVDPTLLSSHSRRNGATTSEVASFSNQLTHEPIEYKPQQPLEQVKKFDLRDHFSYLKQYHPNLNRSDLERICRADLVELYYKAFCAQGMERKIARAKAELAVVEE